jgi:hypothetical protein
MYSRRPRTFALAAAPICSISETKTQRDAADCFTSSFVLLQPATLLQPRISRLDLSDASRNVLLAVTSDSPLRTNTRFKYLVSLAGHAPPIPLGIFKNEGVMHPEHFDNFHAGFGSILLRHF